MLTIDEIKKQLADRRLTVVAERTGLHYNTLKLIRDGKGNPTYSTLKIISDYLQGGE